MSKPERADYPHVSMTLEWDPNDRIDVVTVPELPGGRTHGEALEAAVRQGRDALESWVDLARELGRPLPPPRYFVLDPIDAPAPDPVGVAS